VLLLPYIPQHSLICCLRRNVDADLHPPVGYARLHARKHACLGIADQHTEYIIIAVAHKRRRLTCPCPCCADIDKACNDVDKFKKFPAGFKIELHYSELADQAQACALVLLYPLRICPSVSVHPWPCLCTQASCMRGAMPRAGIDRGGASTAKLANAAAVLLACACATRRPNAHSFRSITPPLTSVDAPACSLQNANLSFNEDVEQMLLASCEANLERLEIESGEDLQTPGESTGFLYLVAKGSFRRAIPCP
jgi:hypothetical protein